MYNDNTNVKCPSCKQEFAAMLLVKSGIDKKTKICPFCLNKESRNVGGQCVELDLSYLDEKVEIIHG